MAEAWTGTLARWSEARLIDEETAGRIRDFELAHAGSSRFRWPILIALSFGALAVGAGVLLFVSAHWETLPPASRFAVVLSLVAVFHLGAAATRDHFPALTDALHAIGTVALGAGIFLAGQIFNLDEHWPGGLMLWALGAGLAWALLKAAPQLALFALLAPAWLAGEWLVASETAYWADGQRVLASGLFLLALAYFTAVQRQQVDLNRRTLMWIGAVAFPPAAIAFAVTAQQHFGFSGSAPLAPGLEIVGWTVAIGTPLLLAFLLRRRAAWPMALAACWALALVGLDPMAGRLAGDLPMYAWWMVGAVGLVAWGVKDARTERINMGAVVFAATVLAFYFSEIMDKLARSASLIVLGLLLLGGGWAIEQLRRRFVLRARGGQS